MQDEGEPVLAPEGVGRGTQRRVTSAVGRSVPHRRGLYSLLLVLVGDSLCRGVGERRGPGGRGRDKKLYIVDHANVLANGRVEQHVCGGVWGWALEASSLASVHGLWASRSCLHDAVPAMQQAESSLCPHSLVLEQGAVDTGPLASLPTQAGMVEVVPSSRWADMRRNPRHLQERTKAKVPWGGGAAPYSLTPFNFPRQPLVSLSGGGVAAPGTASPGLADLITSEVSLNVRPESLLQPQNFQEDRDLNNWLRELVWGFSRAGGASVRSEELPVAEFGPKARP